MRESYAAVISAARLSLFPVRQILRGFMAR